jgi:hypothetical protein
MKLIGTAQGIAAVRVPAEEVYPASNPPVQNIVSGVRALFSFATASPPDVLGTGNPIIFQIGRATKEEQEFGIQHLIMLPDGDIVASTNTDFAEYGLNMLIKYLDNEFGYKMEQKSSTRYYSSTIIVEFENEVGDLIPSFKKIQRIIAGETKMEVHDPFEFLRLSFTKGLSRMPVLPSASLLDNVQNTDFVIERRASQPFSVNRFFCSAPMRTEDHIKALEKIEGLLAG